MSHRLYNGHFPGAASMKSCLQHLMRSPLQALSKLHPLKIPKRFRVINIHCLNTFTELTLCKFLYRFLPKNDYLNSYSIDLTNQYGIIHNKLSACLCIHSLITELLYCTHRCIDQCIIGHIALLLLYILNVCYNIIYHWNITTVQYT